MKIGKGYGLAMLVCGAIFMAVHATKEAEVILILFDGIVMVMGGLAIDNSKGE